MTFAEEIKRWRGELRQKNACDIIGVPLVTFKTWEQGVSEPKDLAKCEVRWRMAAFQKGVPVEVYKLRYLSVIKQVAAEILDRK